MNEQYRLMHLPSGLEIARMTKAEGWWAKGWGVLGWGALPRGQGLWLPGVASVHTVGVRFPLDLLFLDSELRTVNVLPEVPPGRWWVRTAGAAHTIELGAGTLTAPGSSLGVGDRWRLERLAAPPC